MNPKLIVVTAASSNHFGALKQMLESLRRLDARVECYDIGLTSREARALPRWDGFFYHKFDYATHPPHLDVSVNAGEYAWKPVIVAEVVERSRTGPDPSDVLWADAGCYFHSLQPIADRIRDTGGLWVRPSPGVMREWTHPLMFEYLGVDAERVWRQTQRGCDARRVRDRHRRRRRSRGAVSGYRPAVEDVRPGQGLHRAARIVPREPPAGSGGAVLSRPSGGYPFVHDTPAELAVRSKCDRWFYHYIGFDVPAGLYARTCLS